jgi:predicted acyltransferase
MDKASQPAAAETSPAGKPANAALPQRFVSLDFFRGFTMFMLVGEATGLYELLRSPAFQGSILAFIGWQLEHHDWNGLRFWDLIQPFFMFIVGVAMPFSFARRWEKGESWGRSFTHALRRSALLLLFGWGLYCIGPGRITFELWNVLAQLSVTYLVAFLLMRKPAKVQIGVTVALLVATELLYRLWPVAGFNQPFVPDHNFGSWMDYLLMGKLSNGHWVAINALPTTAHTMWGVLAGQVIRSTRHPMQKLKLLLAAGAIGIVVGYALDPALIFGHGITPVTPIIKRICTSSFVIVSGGWALLGLGFSYWLIDIRQFRRGILFFNVVGMNSLFIYMLTNTGGAEWCHRIAKPFVHGIFAWAADPYPELATSVVVWAMLWGLCYWMYKKRIFIRL